tara:strand:- start:55 stop:840 length:786 start_codon:yes stop_codon:yes gene_type:complete
MTEPKKYSLEELYITDNCDETSFVRNNIPNYPGLAELIKGPINTIENNLLADIFNDQFEGTPNDCSILDIKLLHKVMGSIMMDVEALVKCYARNGKNSIVKGQTSVERKCKRTGKIEKKFNITALENLIQAASIGTWLEMVTACRHGGDDHKLHILNGLVDEEIKTVKEMKEYIKTHKTAVETFDQFREKLDGSEFLMDIFPNPSDLATAVLKHKKNVKSFIETAKETPYIKSLEEVDRNILLNKLDDSINVLIEALDDMP